MDEPVQISSFWPDDIPALFVVGATFPDGPTPFLHVSRDVRNLFGFDAEEPIAPSRLWASLRPDDRRDALRVLRQAEVDDAEGAFVFSIGTNPDERLIQARFKPVPQADGTACWWGFFADITETVKQQSALRADLDFFRMLFRTSPVAAVLSRQPDALIFEVNALFLERFGLERHDVIGRAFAELGILADDRRRDLFASDERETTLDAELKTVGGESRMFRVVNTPVVHDGQPCWIGRFFDVTERLRFENEILEKNDALAEANAKLREIGLLRQQFTAMLVHDLKSPLTTVQVLLDLVPTDEPEITEVGVLARRSIEKVLRLVNEMLEVHKSESGESVLVRETVNLQTLLYECFSSAARIGGGKNITVAFDCEPHLPFVPGDPGKLDRVFTNLLSNALKFTPNDGNIAIAAKVTRGVDVEEGMKFVTVTVTDSGPGIPAADLPYIFDLYRQSRSNRDQNGVGLGLAIVRSIVAAHGGNVSVKSKVGVGTQFAVTLPAVRTTGAYPVARFLAEMEKRES